MALFIERGGQILEACQAIRAKQDKCATGEAVITTAGDLPANHVIHSVEPIWQDANKGEPKLLYKAYWNSLKLAKANNIRTIAFPNISTGVYGYPKQAAVTQALKAVQDFVQEYGENVFD